MLSRLKQKNRVIAICIAVIVVAVSVVCFVYAMNFVTPVVRGKQFPKVIVPGRYFVSKLEFKVTGVKVRDLEPPIGVFVYKTSVDITGEGPKYEVWIYNVSKINKTTYLITRKVVIYVNGRKFGSYVETYVIRNNVVYFIDSRTGNVIYRFNTTAAPVSPDCISLLVAPPFWPYVKEGAKWKVVATRHEEFRYTMVPFTLNYRAVEQAQVIGITKCNGPSGKCYIIKSTVDIYYRNPRTGVEEHKVRTYEFYIDYKTGIITYAKYSGTGLTKPIEIRLVTYNIPKLMSTNS